MIIGFLMILGGALLQVISGILSLVNLLVPDAVFDAIVWFFSYVTYLRGVIPVENMLTAVVFYLTVFLGVYLVKIGLWLIAHIPSLNQNQLPKHKK